MGRGAAERREITGASYSGLSKLLECPKAYELSYIVRGVPKKGSVWFVGGLAVHALTEEWDRWTLVPEGSFDLAGVWKRVFYEKLEEQRAKDPVEGEWKKAGVKDSNPDGESVAYWYTHLGPQLCQAYISWRQRSPYQIWATPAGEAAIELDISGSFPGMDGRFRGFIDRIFWDPTFGRLVLVDLKTGSQAPKTALQLGIYGAGITQAFGVDVPVGAAFMNRKGALADAWDLTRFTPEYVGRHFGQMLRAVRAGYAVPNVGSSCRMCDVQAACYAVGGPLAAQFDADYPQEIPF